MKDCGCIEDLSRHHWLKIVTTKTEWYAGAKFHYFDGSGWAPCARRAESVISLYPELYRLASCTECKHKMACIVNSDCRRTFESR